MKKREGEGLYVEEVWSLEWRVRIGRELMDVMGYGRCDK
jgi:hypothetical protein